MITREAIESAIENPEQFEKLVNVYVYLRDNELPFEKYFFHQQRVLFKMIFSNEFPPSFHSKWYSLSMGDATSNKEFIESLNLVHFAALQGLSKWVTQYCRLSNYSEYLNAYTSVRASAQTSDEFIGCGNTPLIFAIRNGKINVVNELIKAGVNINRPALYNGQELAPICYAFFKSRFKIAAKLIKAGCNLNPRPEGTLLECIIIGINNTYLKRHQNCPMPNTLSRSHLKLLNEIVKAGINLNFFKKRYTLENTVITPPLLTFFLESGKVDFAAKKALYKVAKQKKLEISLKIIINHLALEDIPRLDSHFLFAKNQLITAATTLLQIKNLLKQEKPISYKQLIQAFDKLKNALPHSIINQVDAQQIISQFIDRIAKTECSVLIEEELQNLVDCISIMHEKNILLFKIGQALANNEMKEKALYFLTQIPNPDEKNEDIGLRRAAQFLANQLYDAIQGQESSRLLSLTQIREQLAMASTNEILEEFIDISNESSSGSTNEASTSGSTSSVGMYATTSYRRAKNQSDTKTSDNGFDGNVFKL